MTVKMIKNLENKMEKIQESINKGLEELKNNHTNNTVTEIKNALEGFNSRISEAEQIGELEDKMVVTSEKQNKVKRKELRMVSETSGTISNTTIELLGVQRKNRKRKGMRNFLKKIIVENFPNMGKETVKSKRHKEPHTG